MKLRFEVDQAACFRKGIDCPKSVITIEVNPADLTQPQRDLIADRLSGIDVLQLWNSDKGTEKMFEFNPDNQSPFPKVGVKIIADAPTFEGLMAAIESNQAEVLERQTRHRSCAIASAIAGFDNDALMKECNEKQGEKEVLEKGGESSVKPPRRNKK